jgi:hypothetical protein
MIQIEAPDSPADLLMQIARVSAENMARRFVWRGQADRSWPIAHTLYRRLATQTTHRIDQELIDAYSTDLERDIQDHGFFGSSHLDDLARMQHRGAATRLLDVTRDPMVAAWFAVSDLPESDGAVYALDVTTADEWPVKRGELTLGSSNVPRTETVLYTPPWSDERVKAQRGLFLITQLTGSEESSSTVSPDLDVICITIPAALKPALSSYMADMLDMSTSTLFPDFEGLARANGPSMPFERERDDLRKWG